MKKEKKYISKKYVTLVTILLWISIALMLLTFWKRFFIWIGLALFIGANVLSSAKCGCPYCGSSKAVRVVYGNDQVKRCPDCKRELNIR